MLKSVVVAVLAAANIAQADILESRAAGDIAQTATFDEVDIPRPNTLGAQVGTLLGNYLLNFTNICRLHPRSVYRIVLHCRNFETDLSS